MTQHEGNEDVTTLLKEEVADIKAQLDVVKRRIARLMDFSVELK